MCLAIHLTNIIVMAYKVHNGNVCDLTCSFLLKGKAVANMQRHQWSEAMEDLLRAHQQDPTDVDTLVNLIVCCNWLKETEDASRHLA